MTALEKAREEAVGRKFYEHSVTIGDVEYIVFAEDESPDLSVGISGGPKLQWVFRPTGEDITGHLGGWVEDGIYVSLGGVWDRAKEVRERMLRHPERYKKVAV